MFDKLTERLTHAFRKITGTSRLSDENIQETLREIRMALLEADVALPVVKKVLDAVKEKAIGQEILKSLSPGEMLVKIVNDELVEILGQANEALKLNTAPPAIILLAGLQGSGKTTTAAKLARWLIEKQQKKVILTSTDVYRPAAIEQLSILSKEIGAQWFPSTSDQLPETIAKNAKEFASRELCDVLIIDTAGRLHIDEEMMTEIQKIHQATNPIETLFIADSMTGQDAVQTAAAFNQALPLTGIILTKTDGDARGGAALSIRTITGKPIKFIGAGEKTGALEPFYPERLASRILGMGDIVSLVEQVEQNIDKEKAEKLAKKLKKGKSFTLIDFLEQLQQMKKMGGMMSLIGKIPGLGQLPQNMKNQVDDKLFVKIEAIINSMTRKERINPDVINGSRKKRIALGSGTQIQDVNKLLKQFTQMQKMMKRFSKPGAMANMMRNMNGMLPPGSF